MWGERRDAVRRCCPLAELSSAVLGGIYSALWNPQCWLRPIGAPGKGLSHVRSPAQSSSSSATPAEKLGPALSPQNQAK